jgi:hypothetical protein
MNHVVKHAALKGVYPRAESSPPGGLKMRLTLLGKSSRT